MGSVAKDTVFLLQYLLPGFLAAWIFYGLTSYPKPSQFERVVQALIFTLVAQAVAFPLKILLLYLGTFHAFGPWSKEAELLTAISAATIIGVSFSYFANNDKFHSLLRKLRITRETSYPSEWFGAFLSNVTYVVLHLKDERRIYGWPVEWPSDPTSGHFLLSQASWLKGRSDTPMTGVREILVNVNDVSMIEFMEKTWEVKK